MARLTDVAGVDQAGRPLAVLVEGRSNETIGSPAEELEADAAELARSAAWVHRGAAVAVIYNRDNSVVTVKTPGARHSGGLPLSHIPIP